MSELTDLAICKRIAEIEGVEFSVKHGAVILNETLTFLGSIRNCSDDKFADAIKSCGYNPLTDDALCFQLMVKHKVRMHWLWEENDGTPHYEAYINEDSSDIKYDKSPNKAILLCIIEAHKEQS